MTTFAQVSCDATRYDDVPSILVSDAGRVGLREEGAAVTDGVAIAAGLLGADVGSGATPEQRSLVQSLLHGYFGLDVDAMSLEPLSAEELAVAVDKPDRARVMDLLVVVEFCRHTNVDAQADRMEGYARALGYDNPFLAVARDALTAGTGKVMADWARFREPDRLSQG